MKKHIIILTLSSVALTIVLALMGRPFWCSCGQYFISSWDVWSQHNSQHLIDPYSFSHFEHGLIFFYLFAFLKLDSYKLIAALVLEAIWEIAENSPAVIERYRNATAAVGYSGDTIFNSVSDLICCYFGYLFSKKSNWKIVLGLFFIIELLMLITIKDNLTLNVIMLLYPVESIKIWQSQ